MIKESFLRNYSLTKIYTEAEDQKKKIKVFYVRQGNHHSTQSRKCSKRDRKRKNWLKYNRKDSTYKV